LPHDHLNGYEKVISVIAFTQAPARAIGKIRSSHAGLGQQLCAHGIAVARGTSDQIDKTRIQQLIAQGKMHVRKRVRTRDTTGRHLPGEAICGRRGDKGIGLTEHARPVAGGVGADIALILIGAVGRPLLPDI
jgi:hypothetical protein